ncbi:MAG: high frequency lysogenization protein HflD [Gammaproteobacteria bacterium]|nr:high frequency lysogenization protein HflD [Gammaproteobacteria bacterium]
MNDKKYQHQVLALAGLYQACDEVRRVAYSGKVRAPILTTAVDSIFALDAEKFDDIYGGHWPLKSGFKLLHQQLDQEQTATETLEILPYINVLQVLSKRLLSSNTTWEGLRKDLETIKNRLTTTEATHPDIIAALADSYQKWISPLGPRVLVNGERAYLSKPENTHLIRCLLLAALRSAVLWRQSGGNRLAFVLYRKQYIETLATFIDTTQAH